MLRPHRKHRDTLPSELRISTSLFCQGRKLNNSAICEGVAFGRKWLELLQGLLAKCRAPTVKLSILFNSHS
jgi:hypothetical protein